MQNQSGQRPWSFVLRDFVSSFYELTRSELNLARAEFVHHTHRAERLFGASLVFGAITWIGLQILLASIVIGLGTLWGGRYGWSAFAIGLAVTIPGVFLTIRSMQKARQNATQIFPSMRTNTEKRVS